MLNEIAAKGYEAASATVKTAHGFGKNLMLAGAVGAGLLTLAAVLSQPKARRLNLDEPGGNGPDGNGALAFAGNPQVDIGGVAMQVPGQQQQMGSWVSRLPSMQDTQLQPPSLPTR